MASNPNHHANFITAPTKQHDGGSECGSRATIIAAAAAVAPKPKVDAFTKYSSNLIRMKELLLLGHDSNEDDDEDLNYLAPLNDALRHASISISRQNNNNNNNNGVDASKRRRGNDSRPIPQQGFLDIERKTRLSFELHPSLLLHDLMYHDVDFSAHISDDEDEDDETEAEE
jgi:hypothetical protein